MARSPVPFFRYYGTPDSYLDILTASFVGKLNRDERTVSALESKVARFIGTKHAVALPQARLGLYLALRELLTPEKRKVILSPYTIYDVVNMVISAGGIPVFADIDASTCNVDCASAAKLVDDQTGAILVTHLHGLACDIERFTSLCAAKGIPLIEDCAQAFGASVKGKRLGSFGTLGIFSFSVKKHVNSLYGGCLVGNDAEIMSRYKTFLAGLPPERARKLLVRACSTVAAQIANSAPLFRALTFPLLRRRVLRGTETALSAVAYEHNPIRRAELPQHYLRRMSAVQAHLVARQIPDVDRQSELRIAYAREYHALLADLAGVQLPPLREDGSHIYLSFAVQVSDRLRFQREMMAGGCDVRLQSYINTASAPCYAEFGGDCPNAARTASRVVLLPISTGTGIAEIRRIAAVIRALMR
jgi:dTDP-4-amino-4,6-dideoxygalactose transaminase